MYDKKKIEQNHKLLLITQTLFMLLTKENIEKCDISLQHSTTKHYTKGD